MNQINQTSPGYFSNNRIEVQQIINPNSKVILDVGCGAGAMSAELKAKLGAEIWGIETFEDAANIARERLDNVLIGAVEEEYLKLPENYFDSIVFADILEHLVDPFTLLKNISSKLKKSGEIVVSIPNINYWGVIQTLLMCDFPYMDTGILDKTHLRFFTKKTILEMLENAGFRTFKIIATKGNCEPIPENFLKACREIGIDDKRLKEESKCFQYLIKAVKIEFYEEIFTPLLQGEMFMEKENYPLAINYFKEVETNFRKYNDKELYGVKIDLIEEKIKELEKII